MKIEPSWRIAGRAVMFIVFAAFLFALASRYLSARPHGPLLVAAATVLGTLLLTLAFSRMEGWQLSEVGAGYTGHSLVRFLGAFAAGLTLPFLRAGLSMLLSGLRYERHHDPPGTTLLMLAMFIGFASREELQFRGFSLWLLQRRFGAAIAITAISLLFALEHLIAGATWWQALLGPAAGSVLFSVAALRTHGLAVPIGLHAAWNFGDWMLGGKGMGGIWQPVMSAAALHHIELAQWASYIVVMVLATVAISRWPQRNNIHRKG